jgi:hypothetical protein
VDLEDRAAAVLRAVEQELEVQPLDESPELCHPRGHLGRRLLVVLLGSQLTQQFQLLGLGLGLLDRVGPGLQLADAPDDAPGGLLVGPEVGLGLRLLKLVEFLAQGGIVKDPP